MGTVFVYQYSMLIKLIVHVAGNVAALFNDSRPFVVFFSKLPSDYRAGKSGTNYYYLTHFLKISLISTLFEHENIKSKLNIYYNTPVLLCQETQDNIRL